MPFFGQSWEDPQTLGILALSAGLLRGDAGGGILGALQATQEGRQNAAKQKLVDVQLANYQSEIAQRNAAVERQKQISEATQNFFGPGGASAPLVSPGAFAPAADGMGPVLPQSMIAQSQPGSRLAGKSIDEITALHALGGPDLLNNYKLAREGFERKPGTFYESINGGREFVADPNKANTLDANGRVVVQPGFSEALSGTTLAQELPKAFAGAAFGGNVRKQPGPNGREEYVPNMSENPFMQKYAESIFGQYGVKPSPQPAQPAAAPNGMLNREQFNATPMAKDQATAAPDTNILQGELAKKQAELTRALNAGDTTAANRAAIDMQSLKREMGRAGSAPAEQVAQATQAAPAPQSPAGYGLTPNEAATVKGNETYAEHAAKDLAEQRKGIMAADQVAATNIAKYQQIGKLLSDVDGGTLTPMGTHLASTMNSLGFKVDKNLPNKEAAASLANEAALQLRSPAGGAGMPGAMSDQDRTFLASMTPNMAQTAQGRKQVIDSYVAVQQRNQQVASFARNYEKKHGRLDNDFFDQLQAWSNANILFKGQ